MRRLPLLIVAMGLVAHLAAQAPAVDAEPATAPAPAQHQVRVLVVLERDSGEREAWLRGLSIALARSPWASAVVRSARPESTFEEALSEDCALVLRASARASASGENQVSWRFEDALTRESLASGNYRAPAPTERDLSGFFWEGVVEGLAVAVPRVRLNTFLLRGPPGSRVSGFSPRPLVIGDSGELEVVADAPVTYRWRAKIEGSYPLGGAYAFLGSAASVLELQTRPLPRYSFDLGLVMGQFPSLRWDWRFLDDSAFAGLALTSFWPGFLLREAQDPFERPSPLIFLPLVQPGLRAGWYLLPADSLFRPYASLEAFLRIIFPEFRELRLDPLAAWGLLPAFGMEYGPSPRIRVWAEIGPQCYPVADGFLVAASNPQFVWFATETMAVEIPSARFGLRFML